MIKRRCSYCIETQTDCATNTIGYCLQYIGVIVGLCHCQTSVRSVSGRLTNTFGRWKEILLAMEYLFRVPTDTGKPGKMRQLFPVREKSGNFEKMSESQGKVREF